MFLIAPVVIILIAENLGHVKAVTAMTGKNLDPYMGRAFLGDGLATILAGSVGGTGVTTYGENIGVMAANRVYSTLLFVIAACFAILLGFSPKFGAVIQTIPQPILGHCRCPYLGCQPGRFRRQPQPHCGSRDAHSRRR